MHRSLPAASRLEAAGAVIADEEIDEFEVIDGLAHLVARSLVVADAVESGPATGSWKRRAPMRWRRWGPPGRRRRSNAGTPLTFGTCSPRPSVTGSGSRTTSGASPDAPSATTCAQESTGRSRPAEIRRSASPWSAPADTCGPSSGTLELRRRLAVAQPYLDANVPVADVGRFWSAYGLAWREAERHRAIEALEKALEIHRTLGDELLALETTFLLVGLYCNRSSFDQAAGVAGRRASGGRRAPARLRGAYFVALGILAIERDPSTMLAHFDSAVDCLRVAGADRDLLTTLANRAHTLWIERRFDEAIADFRATLAHFRQSTVTTREDTGWVLLSLAGRSASGATLTPPWNRCRGPRDLP